MRRKKHNTPKHLDALFERQVIPKSYYREFWNGYWGESGTRARDRYKDDFVSKLQLELPNIRQKSGGITFSINAAREQAKEIGGYVVRRNKKGRFSKHGRTFQAIRPKGKKK